MSADRSNRSIAYCGADFNLFDKNRTSGPDIMTCSAGWCGIARTRSLGRERNSLPHLARFLPAREQGQG